MSSYVFIAAVVLAAVILGAIIFGVGQMKSSTPEPECVPGKPKVVNGVYYTDPDHPLNQCPNEK